jgi:hypothetical protein
MGKAEAWVWCDAARCGANGTARRVRQASGQGSVGSGLGGEQLSQLSGEEKGTQGGLLGWGKQLVGWAGHGDSIQTVLTNFKIDF